MSYTIQKTADKKYNLVQSAQRGSQGRIGNPGSSIAYGTQAELFADLAHSAATWGWVMADTTAAKNGYYYKIGASGAGNWAGPYPQPIGDNSVKEQNLYTAVREALQRNSRNINSIMGTPDNLALNPQPGYIAKSNGAEAVSASWYRTNFIPVKTTSIVTRSSNVIIGSGSTAAVVAFYDVNRQYLGYYTDVTANFSITVGSVYANAAYVRLSFTTASTTTIYIDEPYIGSNIPLSSIISILNGASADFFTENTLLNGYVNLSGLFVSSTTWRTTSYIPVIQGQSFIYSGTGNAALVSSVSLWDTNMNFLETIASGALLSNQKITVNNASAKYIRASASNAASKSFIGVNKLKLDARTLNLLIEMLTADVFNDAASLANGYINLTGTFVDAANWRTTGFIPATLGQIFTFTGIGNDSLISSVSIWDENKNFLGYILKGASFTDEKVTVTNASAKYVRASAATTSAYSFIGFIGVSSTPKPRNLSYFAPEKAYALKNEALYMFPRGILAERTIDIAWNISQSNNEVCKITPTTSDPIAVKLRAFRDDLSTLTIASFNVLVTDTPVNPSTHRNIICLGDSLTQGINSIEGAYVNELSRRLTGTGTALLSGAQSPAALALSNIHFRGTRGDQPVKHEGRGGWAATDYLNNASVGGVSNAFWNPSTNQFDLDYYLTTNGFDSGSIATGVVSDGSNLTAVILLGWNDVYSSTAESSATNVGILIDKIKTAKPNASVIVLGLNPAPKINFKSFTGERFVSEREIFEVAIKKFGEAYRTMCKSKTNVDFLQLSHVMNPEISYPTTSQSVSLRSADTITGALDHVHPNAVGYAQIADAVFYKILYDYCRG